MLSTYLKLAIPLLNDSYDSFMLVHEAALIAYGLDNNVFPMAIDTYAPGSTDKQMVIEGTNVPIRVWGHLPGIQMREEDVVWSKAYGCRVLRPDLLLETLILSPDIELLWEQRAALAMVLYADLMTDDQLREYDTHVRYL